MRAGVSVVIVAASLFTGSAAWSACVPSRSNNCIDLGDVPQISQQIVAGETIAAPPKTAPDSGQSQTYTGPTLGPTTGAGTPVRRAPTVGYHWSLD